MNARSKTGGGRKRASASRQRGDEPGRAMLRHRLKSSCAPEPPDGVSVREQLLSKTMCCDRYRIVSVLWAAIFAIEIHRIYYRLTRDFLAEMAHENIQNAALHRRYMNMLGEQLRRDTLGAFCTATWTRSHHAAPVERRWSSALRPGSGSPHRRAVRQRVSAGISANSAATIAFAGRDAE
jgi:hypothetical protein